MTEAELCKWMRANGWKTRETKTQEGRPVVECMLEPEDWDRHGEAQVLAWERETFRGPPDDWGFYIMQQAKRAIQKRDADALERLRRNRW